jgi:hypothetical protein
MRKKEQRNSTGDRACAQRRTADNGCATQELMAEHNQIRINELARELEIKAKVLIEYLPEIGVTEKKTHSSSLDIEHAELARKHFLTLAAQEAAAEAAKAAAKAKPARPATHAPARRPLPVHLRLRVSQQALLRLPLDPAPYRLAQRLLHQLRRPPTLPLPSRE